MSYNHLLEALLLKADVQNAVFLHKSEARNRMQQGMGEGVMFTGFLGPFLPPSCLSKYMDMTWERKVSGGLRRQEYSQ